LEFALDEWKTAEVAATQPEQIEGCIGQGLRSAAKQLRELRLAFSIEREHLPVQDGAFDR
jgi:hypothetical protein